MEPIAYVIAIMGCADDGSMCRNARIEPATYATAAQCQAAIQGALVRNTDVDFPTISATCQQRGMRWADRGEPVRAIPRS